MLSLSIANLFISHKNIYLTLSQKKIDSNLLRKKENDL